MIVYLTVSNLDGVIDNSIIPLINESGDKWQDLKDGFLMRVGEVGRGDLIIKYKEGIEHWVLPFESHPEMTQPQNKNDAFVLDKEEFKSYGWDVPNDEI